MPPTSTSHRTTTYPGSCTTRPLTHSRNVGSQELAGRRDQTNCGIDGPRVNSPTRRYRTKSLPMFPLGYYKAQYPQTRSYQLDPAETHIFRRVLEGPPTVTVEQDPNPPPSYVPPISLHASIIPLPSGTQNHPGGANPDRSLKIISTPDVIIFVIIALLGLAFLIVVGIIHRIRRNRRKREETLVIPVKNGPTSAHKARPWQRISGEVGGPPLAKVDTQQPTSPFNAVNCQEQPLPIRVSSFVVSSSTSLDGSSCTDSTQSESVASMDIPFYSYGSTNRESQQKLDGEEADITYALSYAASDSDISSGDSLRTITYDSPILDEQSPTSPGPGSAALNPHAWSDGSVRDLEESNEIELPCIVPILATVEVYQLETAHSQSLEATQAVLVHCPVASSSITEIRKELGGRAKEDEVITQEALLDSPLAVTAIPRINTPESAQEFLAPSFIVTQPSLGNVFSLNSSSSTITVDLNEFPAPPIPSIPRVEVTLPQVDLDFPVYVWDEDADMLTVHKSPGPILDQFIALYS